MRDYMLRVDGGDVVSRGEDEEGGYMEWSGDGGDRCRGCVLFERVGGVVV